MREELVRDLDRRRYGFGEVSPEAITLRSPTCGDEISVSVRLEGGAIRSVEWNGHGCTVSMASASALAALAAGLTLDRFVDVRERFATSLMQVSTLDGLPPDDHPLGEAAVFEGLGRLPLRGRCASLAWDALGQALRAGHASSASTSRPSHRSPHSTASAPREER